MPTASPTPGKTLLNPPDHTLILIDHQSQMAFATKSIDAITLRNNAALVAKSAKLFGVSTVITTVAEKTLSGQIFGEIKPVFPDAAVVDHCTMNYWEEKNIAAAVNKFGKAHIVLAGPWTTVCIALFGRNASGRPVP